ncbi:hypothetical protein ACFP3U_31515 [Kitasatospora misakiensis]|uniref:Peptidase S11 D-alanyl-D-alanine carboxypeptidase A N-terminal domain-containing protein n=1 Tax=Kitasatospora misakiensis TaxID=67330 RepID=A0ABW0XGB9_9ACTN
MGESPDRVLRDGERARDRDGEPAGSAAAEEVAEEVAAPSVEPVVEPEATPESGAAAEADTEADTDAAAHAPADAAAPSGDTPSGDAPSGDSDDSVGDAADSAADGGARPPARPATVQLRVRDADTRTTALRMPVDQKTTALRLPAEDATTALRLPSDDATTALRLPSDDATTALRLPDELRKPSGATAIGSAGKARKSEAGKGGAGKAEAAGAVESGPSDRPAGTDPRLAMRTPKPAPTAPAEPADAAEDADGQPASASASASKSSAVAAEPAARAEKFEKRENVERTRVLRVPAAPAGAVPEADTAPKPPTPRPLPESVPVPQPGPDPEPKPAPAPKPAPKPKSKQKPHPAPAAEPLPAADPRPVPPAPPLPAPEPEPFPESTSEAMDVLAALNSRPVSPLRRALKRITVWTLFLAVVLGVVVTAQLLRPLPDTRVRMTAANGFGFAGDPLDLAWPAKGQSAAEVVGIGSLGSSGPETPASIASVTKVMNAYLILQAHPLKKGEGGPKITVDKQAAQESGNVDESRVTLTEGQQLSQYQALELLMLPSANNVARLLARWDAGSEEAFVRKMNDTAARFGMANTTYTDPAGYNQETRSTAKDQLKLAGQVMQDDIFRQIVSTPDTTFNNQKISNTNTLINPKTGVIGVKTGSSTPAGGCLMWAAYKDIAGVRRLILGVTLGQPATAAEPSILKVVQSVSAKQIQAAQNGLTGQTLAKQGDVVGRVEDGLGGSVPVVAAGDLTVAGFPGVTGTLVLDPVKVGHRVTAGTRIGVLRSGEGSTKVEVPVVLKSELAPPSILARLTRAL